MKPTPAEMEKGMLRDQSAMTPPTIANGILRKMSTAGRSSRNARKSSNMISASESGTTTSKRSLASA